VSADRIFDGRLMFSCAKCQVCGLVAATTAAAASIDEAYAEFLDRYDSNQVSTTGDLRPLMEQEKIVRPKREVDSLLSAAGAKGDALLEEVLHSERDYVVDFRAIEEPPPDYGDSTIQALPVDSAIIDVLAGKGIEKLYRFQQEAVEKILQGADVVITAPTASGKTEAFCIPVLQKIAEGLPHFGTLRSGEGRIAVAAIFVYPTKALARDQLPKIKELAEPLGVRAAVLDGDTPEADRRQILESLPDIVVTNFDVIHYHMMHRTKFSRALRTARFLVVDEAHVYTGVFGANVHHIIARLERLAGRKMQVVAASATLPNAGDFCQSLFGRKMHVVQGRGRRGKINLAIIFPSLRSHRSLAIDLVKQAAKKHRTIAFSGSHLGAELLAFYAARQGVSIRVHRAGLLPAARAEIEQAFRSGKIAAISATPTLELGIDIGSVDAIVSNIVPVNRLTQRIGRAARRGQQGYAFLALGNDPISQYYKSHPDDYLSDQELAYTDPENPFVKEYQTLAMACDRPIVVAESRQVWETLRALASKGLVKNVNGRFVPDLKKAMEVLNNYSIRGIGSRVDIKLGGRIAGDRSMPQALEELHKDAIYFLAGRRYRVREFHYEQQGRSRSGQPYAELEAIPYDYPYYTKALTDEWPSITEVHERKKVFGVEAAYCSLRIKKQVRGYANMEVGQEATQGRKVMFDRALEYEFDTKGFVFRAPRPEETMSKADSDDDGEYVEMSAFHASEHVLIEGSAMITGGASQDLGGISLGSSGLIFVYDGSVGGNGASRVLYDRLEKAFGRALRILSECPCTSESGCPRCTFSYRCGNNNEYLHKAAAIEALGRIVEGERTEIGEEEIQGDRALV
jgi:DEAD/DEAH box helicase domain-containing protein